MNLVFLKVGITSALASDGKAVRGHVDSTLRPNVHVKRKQRSEVLIHGLTLSSFI